MATITETTVEVRLAVRREGAEGEAPTVRVVATAISYDSDGERVRAMDRDITDQMTSAQVTGATNLLDAVIARVKAAWEIA